MSDRSLGITNTSIFFEAPTELKEKITNHPLTKKLGPTGVIIKVDEMNEDTFDGFIELLELVGFKKTYIMASGIQEESRARKIAQLQQQEFRTWAEAGNVSPNPQGTAPFSLMYQLADFSKKGFPKQAKESIKRLLRLLYE